MIEPRPTESGAVLRTNWKDPLAVEKISATLSAHIAEFDRINQHNFRLVLCIGSDRSTGDSLGPLVGTRLAELRLPRTIIWGTLASPVHALNLESYIEKLQHADSRLLVIAVDASLGKPGSIGLIEVGKGPLFPGAGVNKSLPPVGNIYLSGIVNIGGFMEQMVLQSTRLYHVMEIAAVITRSLHKILAEEKRPEINHQNTEHCLIAPIG